MWTFHEARPRVEDSLQRCLQPGIGRGRVTLYSNIDCHHFLPHLYAAWQRSDYSASGNNAAQSNPVKVSPAVREQIHTATRQHWVIEGDDEDRPPVVDICVGREPELETLAGTAVFRSR